MKTHKIYIILICIIIFLGILLCLTSRSKSCEELPDEILNTIDNYMTAYKISTEQASKFIHFENEDTKKFYIESGEKALDYRIESFEKINDNLYGITVLIKTNMTENNYLRVYNFVLNIDGEWKYANGVNNIPDNLSENLDNEKYSYH